MSDDHSELAPLLPIPNRTVKRLCADDSVHTYVKVGHRQTPCKAKCPTLQGGAFCFVGLIVTYCNEVTTRATGACCGGDSYRFHRCDVETKAGHPFAKLRADAVAV